MRTNCLFLLLFLIPALLHAQAERRNIRSGNQSFYSGKYGVAEKEYRTSLQKNKNSFEGNFNLGDALYKQNKLDDATKQFDMLTKKATSKQQLAETYHNLGNTYLQQKKFEESIKAYKQALKANPADDDTRYNLAYAQKMLQQQQQQQQKNQNKQDQNKQDQNKENKDQQKKDDKEKNGEKNKEQTDKDQKDKKQEQPEPQPSNKMSKEDAERLLEALNKKEKELHNKKKKKDGKAIEIQIEKDW